jgi:hypothetical protein
MPVCERRSLRKKTATTAQPGLIVEGLRLGAIAELLQYTNAFAPKTLNDQTTCEEGNRDRLEEIGIGR